MPETLVKHAIEQSRGREPVVRVMALLHGARVLAAVDREGAKRMSGMDAARLLDEIPDTDLALFGAIELAAGVLGLPQSSGVRVGRASRRRR
jgi:hypothetical protein